MTRRAGSAVGMRRGMAHWCQVRTLHSKHSHHGCPQLQSRLLSPALCAVAIIHLPNLHSTCGTFQASAANCCFVTTRPHASHDPVTAVP